MNKVAQYLRKHIKGEVLTSKSAREYFATDGSVFTVMPKLVVYPRSVSDVRKVAKFTWQLAEKGVNLPITARGRGTCQGGGALGSGTMLVFPSHLNRLLELGKDSVVVEPGMNYRALQDILISHGRYLPPYPSSIDYCTLGGAVANNAAGENTYKYGATREFVKSLEVVLSNGDIIETKRLNKRQLSLKMGQDDLEGEIYRQLDSLIMDNWELIQAARPGVSKNSAGYDLWDVKRTDGSFDLTPLIVGSQGTLGIVTKITLFTAPYNPKTSLVVAHFDDIAAAGNAVEDIQRIQPASIEVVDGHLLEFIHKTHPADLEGLIDDEIPKIVLLIKLDNIKDTVRKKKVKQLKKILTDKAREIVVATDPHDQENLWKIRHSAAAVIQYDSEDGSKALPIIEDGVVPRNKFSEYIDLIYKTFEKYNLEVALWGHAGDGNLHMQPFLNLSNTGDRQKVFKVMDDYYSGVMKLGGSTAGEHNDGMLRAPYLPILFGKEMYDLFKQTKTIFDPKNILNTGVKIDVSRKDQVDALRTEYSMNHLADHMPRS